MENPYIDYYMKQAGSGITGFSGDRYHVGNGFFGKILKNLKPALKYIGRHGWEALKSMSADVINGVPVADTGRNTLINTAQTVLNDANQKLETYKKRKQTGSGRKRIKRVKKRVKRVKRMMTKKKKVYKTKKQIKRKKKRKAKVVSLF